MNVIGYTKSKIDELLAAINISLGTKVNTSTYTNGLAGKADSVHSHPVADLTATGSPTSSTFLRGDNQWATPAGGAVDSVNGEAGIVILDAFDVGAIPAAQKGAASGVAPLGTDGKVPAANLPQGDIVMTVDPRLCGSVKTIQAANRGYYMRAYGAGTISAIGLNIGTTGGNLCVAVYANVGTGRNAHPGTVKASSGTVVTPASGYREIALGGPVAVDEGDWLFVAADNVTVTFRTVSTFAAGISDQAKGFSCYQETAFPAPATATVTPIWDIAGNYCLVGVA